MSEDERPGLPADAEGRGRGRSRSVDPGKTAGGIRARVRAEMLGEIKAVARRQLAAGAAELSLRAVARELGMVSSGLYRYFASRDELLTALIMDAYRELGDAAEQADAAVPDRTAGPDRWLAATRAIRAWAKANPAEYALLYGTPVPGYRAPEATTAEAWRAALLLGRIAAETGDADAQAPPMTPALTADITRIRSLMETASPAGRPGVGDGAVVRGMIAWTLVFGALNFDLFGRLDQVVGDRDEWFECQMGAMVDYLGIRR